MNNIEGIQYNTCQMKMSFESLTNKGSRMYNLFSHKYLKFRQVQECRL